MFKYLIKATENVRRLERTMGFSMIGQELVFGKWINGQWAGYAKRPTPMPTVTIPVWLVLEDGDVEEVHARPLEEVEAEAAGRSLP